MKTPPTGIATAVHLHIDDIFFLFSKPYKDNVIYSDTANSKQDLLENCRVESCQITPIVVIFLTEILHMNKDYLRWRLKYKYWKHFEMKKTA